MRKPLKLVLILVLAMLCGAGPAVPAALAAGSSGTGTAASSSSSANAASSGPGFGLGSAEENSVSTATTTTSNVVSTVTSTSSSGGLSGLDAVLIAAAAVLVLGGISFFVWRDARGHAARIGHGSRTTDPMFGVRSHAGSKTPRRARKPKLAERKRRKRGRAR